MMYIIKVVFLGFLSWRQMSFVWGVQTELSKKLFVGYLRLPYSFHLQHNSAQLIHNISYGTSLFSQNTLTASTTLIIETLAFISVTTLLIINEPYGTLLIVSLLGLIGLVLSRSIRNHTLYWGECYQKHEKMLIQYIQQGLGAIKDVKLLGCEDYLLRQYQEHSINRAKFARNKATVDNLPPFLIEMLAVLGLAVLVVTMIWQNKTKEEMLPVLGLFAAGSFRLMPSINRILGAIQNIRFSLPIVDILYKEICIIDREDKEKFLQKKNPSNKEFSNVITIDKLCFGYPNTKVFTLKDISLSIRYGATIGFVGSSGAGKSTLVNIILGLFAPNKGTVNIDGANVENNLRGWQNQIGYVSQSIYLIDDTLRRNIAFGLPEEDINEVALEQAVRAAQLEQFIKDLPLGMNTIVGERGVRLSGGQCQRIGIARALYHDPKILVLDEATNSLDIITERSVMDVVYDLKGSKTIIIVAHRLSTVERCDHVFHIENGRIVRDGKPSVILKTIVEHNNFKPNTAAEIK
ncbi:MAG TPA: ATPase [Coxiellaceae bacterium]|nr:ATPase [Coxiellaceae bacterium]